MRRIICTLIIASFSALFGLLILPHFTSQTLVQAGSPGDPCTVDADCGIWQSPNNYCCNNNVSLCNDKYNLWCDLDWGFCDIDVYNSTVQHTDRCACGCSGTYPGYCLTCPVRCSNPDGAEGDWRYDCSLATAGGCTVAEGCVGLPQQCRSGTWVTTNPSGECTTDCTNCSHATPTPTPAPTPTPTPPPGVCENNCGGLGVCGFRKPDNSCTTDNSCCHRVCNASRVCVTEAGGGNNACDNNAGCVGPTPTPTPTPVPGCDTSALTIIPNPARVGDRMLFRYPPAQDQNLGIDTWNPSTSVSGCYRDVLANRQYICTAAQATSPTGTWTHKWNFGNCSKTATYTINPGYTPWIQVTGDVHSNVRIYAPGGP